MRKKLNSVWFGFLLGLLGIALGMFIVLITRTGIGTEHFKVFFEQFVSNSDFQQNILLFSIFPNPILFFVFNRLDMERTANGIVGISLILAIYVIAIAVL